MKMKMFLAGMMALALATTVAAQNKISGTSKCAKPETQQALEVGDVPNHSFAISKVKCTWSKPLEIAGLQSKEDSITAFDEIRGPKSSGRGAVVLTMSNGDQAHVSFSGAATLKDGVPQTSEGKWRFMRGTGKLKGLKGEGTYKGTGGADGMTYEVEGAYTLPTK